MWDATRRLERYQFVQALFLFLLTGALVFFVGGGLVVALSRGIRRTGILRIIHLGRRRNRCRLLRIGARFALWRARLRLRSAGLDLRRGRVLLGRSGVLCRLRRCVQRLELFNAAIVPRGLRTGIGSRGLARRRCLIGRRGSRRRRGRFGRSRLIAGFRHRLVFERGARLEGTPRPGGAGRAAGAAGAGPASSRPPPLGRGVGGGVSDWAPPPRSPPPPKTRGWEGGAR